MPTFLMLASPFTWLIDLINVVFSACTGAIGIKTLLMENNKLQVLYISSNQIGNEGVAAVCEGLYNNTNLTELMMWSCGLSMGGTYTTCGCSHTFLWLLCMQ